MSSISAASIGPQSGRSSHLVIAILLNIARLWSCIGKSHDRDGAAPDNPSSHNNPIRPLSWLSTFY